jgi:plasmid stabilization system protein ParE
MDLIPNWSKQADADIDEIITYILTKWTGKAALDFVDRLEVAQNRILEHPFASPVYDKSKRIRVHQIDDHNMVYYRVLEEYVEFLRVYPMKKDRSNLNF